MSIHKRLHTSFSIFATLALVIWVVNGFSSNVMKLDASTGAVLGTFPLGLSPFDILFDGVNMWVSSVGGNSVTNCERVMAPTSEPLQLVLVRSRLGLTA